MGCSLRESIPVVLIEWQRTSCDDRGRGESNEASLLQPSGGAQRWPSPCLPISESPSLAPAAGGRGGSRAGQASFVAVECWRCGAVVWRCQTHQPRPSPTPGLAGLPSRSAIASLPVSPAAPPSNSATARPLRGFCRCFAAPRLKLRPQAAASQACAWPHGFAVLVDASYLLRFSPHTSTPALPCSP